MTNDVVRQLRAVRSQITAKKQYVYRLATRLAGCDPASVRARLLDGEIKSFKQQITEHVRWKHELEAKIAGQTDTQSDRVSP